MKKVLLLYNSAIHKNSAVLNTMKENFELIYLTPSLIGELNNNCIGC